MEVAQPENSGDATFGVTIVKNHNLAVPAELIECVSAGTSPTVGQVTALAARIWRDAGQYRSAFGWNELAPDGSDRIFALRSAALALDGN